LRREVVLREVVLRAIVLYREVVLREAVLRREIVLRDVHLRPLSLACSSGAKVRTKPSFDSGGDALLKVGASGRSIQVTVSSFRAPRCSAVER